MVVGKCKNSHFGGIKTWQLPTKIIKPILEPEPPKTPTEPIAGLPSNTANTGIAGTIQTMPGGSNTTTTSMPSNTIDDKIYEGHDVVDLPEFPGGDEALMSYLSTHIKYPSRASSNDIEGKVVLSFVVNKVGEIDEIKIERNLCIILILP